ncbi:Hypothetical predicted protein [Paramuricea clavata]|uniref:Uncharacterized protein n=1 Tax=Paramuricea clavata TaxID=317549 RepID=A0A7D9L6J5_PARCT|nr:Hypothetical predicted protein [Paramuricea clavata]
MENYFIHLCVAAILVVSLPIQTKTLTADEKSNIEKGIEAGKTIAEALKDSDFRKSLVNLGKNLAPFLGVLGPLAGIALSFIPGGESAELAFMKEQFKEVNAKLDIITAEFKEVKNAVVWSSVLARFGPYEAKIRAASRNLDEMYRAEELITRKALRNEFIRKYQYHFDDSLDNLYDAVMLNKNILSPDLLQSITEKTKNHKRKFESFCMGLTQILIEGIKVKISYFAMQHNTTHYLSKKWAKKMNAWKDKIQSESSKLKNEYWKQLVTDVEDMFLRYRKVGNKKLNNILYDFVTDKYDWFYWFVAVYNDIKGYQVHTIIPGKFAFLHRHGKCFILANVAKDNIQAKTYDLYSKALPSAQKGSNVYKILKDYVEEPKLLLDHLVKSQFKSIFFDLKEIDDIREDAKRIAFSLRKMSGSRFSLYFVVKDSKGLSVRYSPGHSSNASYIDKRSMMRGNLYIFKLFIFY